MRASLASVTVSLAVLLLGGREAVADPIVTAAAAIPFYYVLGTTWDAGTDRARTINASDTNRFLSLTTGAASTTGGYSGPVRAFPVEQSELARLAAPDPDDGTHPSLRRPAGTGSAGNSVFVGTAGHFRVPTGPWGLSAAGPASSRIASTAVRDAAVSAFFPILRRTAVAANRDDAVLSTFTAEGHTTGEPDVSVFSILSPSDSSAPPQDTAVSIPIIVVGAGGGELPPGLTIFTAESVALNQAGAPFSYFFDRAVVP